MTIHETACAKINLDLRICQRREDGYHDLDSMVVFTDFGDRLSFSHDARLTFSIDGPFAKDLLHEPDNLVLKAARLLALSLGRSPDVHIVLNKRLPIASGIGGGSADAAAVLRGLVRLWNVPVTASDLALLAGDLGADVKVCLGSRPVRMTGIGDVLAPFDLPAPLPILLVNPGTPVATPAVFSGLRHMSGARVAEWRAGKSGDFQSYLMENQNDLETPALHAAPIIGEVLTAIGEETGCRLARMSGSGATCFGLFDNPQHLDRAKRRLKADHPDWWILDTVCR